MARLQHQDGHSHILASTVPNCVAYDPAYAYELTVIIQDGLRRMYHDGDRVFYYLTCMNENYVQPPMPPGVKDGILRGMYQVYVGGSGKVRVQLLGSGTILLEVLAAGGDARKDFRVPADVWSVTLSELRRAGWTPIAGTCCTRRERASLCGAHAGSQAGPFVAATVHGIVTDQIRPWIAGRYAVLGTDGFGRSDSRAALRDIRSGSPAIVLAAMKALAGDGAWTAAVRKASRR